MSLAITQAAAPPAMERYSILQIVLLHLAPGVIIGLVFAALARIAEVQEMPATLALLVTWLIVGIPILLGTLFYQGFRRNGKLSLRGILLNRQPLPLRQYAWLVPALLVWTAVSSTVLYQFATALREQLFAGQPAWLDLSAFAENPTHYPPSVVWAIVILSAVLNVAVPITEELYFRSYLLPRLPFGRGWSPLVNAVLFSLYHFWLPWDFFGRIIALLPVVYVVQWKRNVYLSILVHCLLNTLGTIGLLVLVMK